MHLIWHGTAAVEVVSGGDRLLFDPFVPLPGSSVPVEIGDFDGFDHIFVTHGHIDHILDLPRIVKRNPGAVIHCTGTPYRTLRKKGVEAKNLALLAFGDELEIGGFRIRVFHGRHARLPLLGPSRLAYMLRSPARGSLPFILREHLARPEKGETVFYQIEAEGRSVSLMGSLNLRRDVRYPAGADLLVLPYNGWEDNYRPAVRVVERLRPRRTVLDHYDDTFPPVTIPLDLTPILERWPDTVAPMELGRPVEV